MQLLRVMMVFFMLCSCGNENGKSVQIEQRKENISAQTQVQPEKESGIVTEYMSFYDSIGLLPEAITNVIPEGFLPLDTAIGDLNLDGIDDILLVVKNKKEHAMHDQDDTIQYDRPLLVLLGAADGAYSVVRRNDHVVLCLNCSGIVSSDPYNDIKIKNGFFSVEHGVAEGPQHWSQVTTFKFDKQQNEWFLFKEGHIVYNPINDDNGHDDQNHTDIKTKKDFGIVPFGKYKIAD